MESYVLSKTTWPQVVDAAYRVALLPWGATEAHNRHLPYATDTIQCEAIAVEASRIAWEAGARVAVLPAVPFGVNAGQVEIPMTLHVRPATQEALLTDLAESLVAQGIHRLILLNGHGGNDFRAMVRGLQADLPDMLIVLVDWYRMLENGAYFDEPGDHAGEMETSLMQHLVPDLVRPLEEAGPGTARTVRLRAVREGWAWTPRHWPSATDDTGIGDPSRSSAEKGARFFSDLTARLAGLIRELDALNPGDAYG
jgi:creatinine amidohydrolase